MRFACITQAWVSRDRHNSGPIDASIAATQAMLAAFDEGIGSTWVRGFNAKKVSMTFGLPDNLEPICMLPMGYPAEGCEPHKAHFDRMDLDRFATYR